MLLAATAWGQAQPKLHVVQPVFEFGEAAPGVAIRHEFEIRNDGAADLVLREAFGGCSCTTAIADAIVKPGNTGTVRATLDTTGMGGGPLEKQISLFTNDPAAPQSTLTLRGAIRARLGAEPQGLRLEAVQGESGAAAAATVFGLGGDTLEIARVESTLPALHATVRPATAAESAAIGSGPQWRVEIAIDPAAPLGPVDALVRVHAKDETEGVLVLPVRGWQRAALELTPPAADLGEVAAGPSYGRVLVLENRGAASVELVSATATVPGVTLETATVEPGRRFEIVVRLDAGLAKGPFAGTLVLRTTSTTKPVLEVPLSGTVS